MRSQDLVPRCRVCPVILLARATATTWSHSFSQPDTIPFLLSYLDRIALCMTLILGQNGSLYLETLVWC